MRFPVIFFKQLWRVLTEPFETLPQIGDRRRSVATSAFLLFSFIAVGLEQMTGGNTPFAALVVLFVSYFLARTRWYKQAALALLITLSFPSFLVALTIPDPNPSRVNTAFAWIILPLLLSGLIYSVRTLTMFSLGNIVLLLALPFVRPELNFGIMGATLGFYILTSIFLITVMVQRNEIEKDRQAELVESRNNLAEEAAQREKFAEQAQRRADQLVMLNEINQAVSNTQGLDPIFNVIFEKARHQFQPDVFYIGIHDEKAEFVTFPILYDNGQLWDQAPTPLNKAVRIKDVIRSRKPLLLNPTSAEIEAIQQASHHLGDQTRTAASVIITPLFTGDKVVGVISIQSYIPGKYANEDLALLTAIAQQAAIAIENARLYEQTTQRAQRLAILNEIGRELSTLSDLPSLLENIYLQVQKTLSADLFFIGLYDRANNEIAFPIMYDAGRFWKQAPGKVTDGTFSGKAILTQQPLLINDWSDTVQEGESAPTIIGDTTKVTRSLMFAPMLFGKEAIGVISAQSYKPSAYNEEDLNLLLGIANQVAVAIQNTRLLEETKQNAGYLATLNELGRVVSELRELPELLEVIYEQVKKHLNADAFFVGLFNPDGRKVSYPLMVDEGVRYHPQVDTLTPHSFLYNLLHGGGASMLLRTEAEIRTTSTEIGMLGNESKISASLLTAPIKVGEQVIGLISAQSYTLNAYTENDLDLLVGIGNQVGVAIQNARLVEEIKQNAEHLSILNEVGRAVSKIMELPDLLEVVYEQGKKSISLDAFYVGLHHPDGDEVSFPIMYDSGVRFEQTRGFVSRNSFMRRFLNGEKPILMNRTKEELAQGISNQKTLGKESKLSASLMAAPLISRDQVIGVISAQSYTLNAYNETDLRLLEGIANQVSIAIENSRLYTSAQQEIMERQKAEEQLRAAETKYRELVERVPAVIYNSETGPTGRWFYVSPQITSLLGYTADEWLADPDLWYSRIHPDDREYAAAAEAEAVSQNKRVEMEYRMVAKDDRLLWIHDESINVSISDNQQVVVQGFLMDVTIRKQTEQTLKESEERYHSLFIVAERQTLELTLLSEVQDALARELDLSDLIHTVVEAIAKTFGYTFVSLYLLDKNQLHLQHQVGYDTVIETIPLNTGVSGRVVNTGKSILIKDVATDPDFLTASQHVHSEVCVPLFDGDVIFGTLNVESAKEYPLTEDDLRLMNMLSEQINIAIRRARLYAERAESLRREQHINELAHTISSTLDLPVILEKVAQVSVALIGAETGTISLMSNDGMEMTNIYSFNEDPRIKSGIIPKGQGLTWLAYELGRPVIVDDYAEHPHAADEWKRSGLHAFMGIPISAGEKRLGMLAVYNRDPEKKFTQRDLSLIEAIARETAVAIQNVHLFDALQKELAEHKQTQDQLQIFVHELEAKNAELERFTYSVSHDLKSPLVTIGGFLGFLEGDIKAGNTQKMESTIQRIRDAAKRMERLLNEVLELSRIGRIINPPVEVPFGELVGEAVEQAHGQLTERQVRVEVEAGLPVVNVDRVRMVEVLQNLIVNAVKFMGGQQSPLIEIGAQTINNEKTFYMRDNGIGIAPEYHKKIFGLFDKLDARTDGTGIGLALVKRIVEVHGGKIWIESEVGKGATFFFTLELKKQQENL